jgi:hypothetical protein
VGIKIQSEVVAGFIAVGLAMAAYGVIPVSATDSCEKPAACLVSGAEVDDPLTAQARKVIGSGPSVGLAADQRMKADLAELGMLENGLKVYSFRYLWEDQVRVGVVAQDLLSRDDLKKHVLTLANGLLGVDYAGLGLRVATLQQWQEAGIGALKADYVVKKSRTAQIAEPVQLFNQRPQY